MCKRYVCLIFVVMMGVTGIASAAVNNWTPVGGSTNWNVAGNWSLGNIPNTTTDEAKISGAAGTGPVVGSSTTVSAYRIFVGSSVYGELTINGGTLTTTGYMTSAYVAADAAVITMSSGTVQIGSTGGSNGHLYLGRYGSAILNISGGTFTIVNNLYIGQYASGSGTINLSGGTLTANNLLNTGTMSIDITAGTLIINGDVTSTINGYVTGGQITAYGGAGTVNVSYNTPNAGKTTVTATAGGPPSKATSPSPANSATGVSITTDLGWTAGSGATSHDVYFGTSSPGTFQGNQAGTSFDTGTMAYNTTYYWRINEKNAAGTTTGDVWSFTTAAEPPPQTLTAYYCDVDAMSSSLPMTVGGNLNSKIVATSAQYTAIASSDNSRWTTLDPGSSDEVFLWLENTITESNIDSIDLHFEGYLSSSSATFSIWARNVASGQWDQIGTTQSIPTGSDGTITRSITSNIGNYVSGEKLIWGVYESTSSQKLNIDYVNVVVHTSQPQPPSQASNPSPASGATGISITNDLGWTAGSGATSHDVYFGTSSPGTFQGNQAGTTFDTGTMANNTTYYWRIDEKNAVGTTAGVVWSFTTASATGGDINWTNGNGNRLWGTAANWSGSVVPTSADKAAIRNSSVSGPIIASGTNAVANQVVVGDWSSTSDTLDMTGGTLTTGSWITLGYGSANNGTLTISGGTVNAGSTLYVGNSGTGTINMTGGTITVASTLGIAQLTGSTGDVFLDGGTISCDSLNMTSGGALDITTGTLIVNGDARTTINGYISSALITAYGGAGTLNVDYNVTNSGKTTVTATQGGTVANLRKGPYLIYPGVNTQMTVLWQIDAVVTCNIAWGTSTSYSTGNANTNQYGDYQHKYNITGLTPGTRYYYRVTIGSNNYTGSFNAAPASNATSVKFFMYGDTRTNGSSHNTVAGQMVSTYNADAAYRSMVLHAGDWVNGDTEAYWTDEWYNYSWTNIVNATASMPFMGAIGNHEGSGTCPVFDKYRPFPFVAAPAEYYSFDYGPVHVAVVDQYTSYTSGSAQYNWLHTDLANSTKPWKIIVLHQPGWSCNGGHANDTTVQSTIQPLCVDHGVSIVLGGHNHYYSRAVVNGVHHLTHGGGGAPLYTPLSGQPNIVTYTQSLAVSKVVISGNTLTCTTVNSSGSVIDQFSVENDEPYFTFVHASDPQMGFLDCGNVDYLWGVTIDKINTINPDFVVVTGDLIQNNSNATQTALYKSYAAGINPGIPIYTLPGNHDISEPSDLTKYAWWASNFGYPPGNPNPWYSFTYGNNIFICIDSGVLKSPFGGKDIEEMNWLTTTLSDASSYGYNNIIVLMHIPLCIASTTEEDRTSNMPLAIRTQLLNLFHLYGVRAVFSGHTHYDTYVLDGDLKIISVASCTCGGGAPQDVPGISIVRVYSDHIEHEPRTLDSLP